MLVIGPSQAIIVGPSGAKYTAAGPGAVVPKAGGRSAMVIGPAAKITIAPSIAEIVQPPARGAWDENGWACQSSGRERIYQGYYRANDRHQHQTRKFHGRIIVSGHEVIPFIADPPNQIKRHPKGPCFSFETSPWFRVHWHHPARNVDDAILYIEKILEEAINDY